MGCGVSAGPSVGSGRHTRRDRLEKLYLRKAAELGRIQARLDQEESKIAGRSLDSAKFHGADDPRGHQLFDASRPGACLEGDGDEIATSRIAGLCLSPDLLEFVRRIITEADKGRALPTPQQVAMSFVAFCYVMQVPFVERYTLKATAADLGCNCTIFHRRVHRWAAAFGMPVPHAKAGGGEAA